MRRLRLGTRASRLARTQSEWVAKELRRNGIDVDLVSITTHGDVSSQPLAVIGGTGVFVSALRDALLAGEVDLAVHSLKDLPTAAAPGLALAAVPPRADPRDALIAAGGATLSQLRFGARVGTGSPRRRALLLDARPDLDVLSVRGNVDTRLRMVADTTVDAVVLAAAGLSRLGRLSEATELLAATSFVPAPGQGALAVECRADDPEVGVALAVLDSPADRLAVAAERRVLGALEAGCSAPVGAYARPESGMLQLRVAVGGPAGLIRHTVTAPVAEVADAIALGSRAAADLFEGPLGAVPLRQPVFAGVGDGPGRSYPHDQLHPHSDPESGL